MSDKVYVLVWELDGDAYLLGVFSDKPKAKKALDDLSNDENEHWKDWDFCRIIEMTLNEVVEKQLKT